MITITGVLTFVVALLVTALVAYCVYWLAGWVGCPETPRRLVTAIVAVLLLIAAVCWTFALPAGPVFRP